MFATVIKICNEVDTVELSEFMRPSGEDDSNASDDDFEDDKTYQQEFDEQELEDFEHLANNQGPDPEDLNLDNEQQDDYFQHPDTALDEMSESTDSIESPIPTLNLDEYSNSNNESTSSNLWIQIMKIHTMMKILASSQLTQN